VLDFCPGVNAIVGDPDSGKTNILRAIRWALTNRPLGFRLHSNFAKEETTRVEIDFDDGSLSLEKSKSKTTYVVGSQKYTALKSDVPVEVADLARIGEVNLQQQLDSPFMIGLSPAEAAKTVSRIVQLESADRLIAKLTSKANRAGGELKDIEEQIAEKEKALAEVPDLSDLERGLSVLERIASDIGTVEKETASLSEIVDLLSAEGHVNLARAEIDSAMIHLDAISDLNHELGLTTKSCEMLGDDTHSLAEAEKELNSAKRKLAGDVDDFESFLKTVKSCPFCDHCKTEVRKHSLDELLREF